MLKKIGIAVFMGIMVFALVGCSSVSQEEALEAAYKHAGIDSSKTKVDLYSQEMDDDGYSFGFEADGVRYKYEIDKSGKVEEYKKEKVETTSSTNSSQNNPTKDDTKTTQSNTSAISEKDAIAKAYKEFGVSESDVKNLKVHSEKDDGIEVFDIEFDSGEKEYSCEIDKSTGNIVSRDIDSIYD